ncbi:MAG: protease pro-enzyme activation domain-containing protein, partial [Terriglobales bacterium]
MKTRTLVVLAIALAFITTFSLYVSYAQTPMLIANAKKIVASITAPVQHLIHASLSGGTRITQEIDETKTVRLARNTRPEANLKNDRGPVSDSFNAEHMLLLLQRSPEKEKELDQLIESFNDKNSGNFHKWLTAEEFGDKFGVDQADLDKVTGWLESHGFRVNQVYTNRILIDFSGTAGQIKDAFHTSIHQLDVKGQMHFANMGDPQIPAALAPVVKGIASLNDFRPKAMHERAKPLYTVAGCSNATQPTFPGTCYFVTPQDDAAIYNLNPLWSQGITGAGQTVAV